MTDGASPPGAFPIDEVRAAFPALAVTDGGRPRVYLDNPAGTQVPRRVGEAAARALLYRNANLGGYFASSVESTQLVADAHRDAALFLGASSEREVVIGPSMTALTFEFSRSLGRRLKAGDEIAITRMEHDGNVAPWLTIAQERGATVRWVPLDRDSWVVEPEALRGVLSDKTRIVALNYASNLTGSINDVKALVALARDAGALVYVDAVQFSPHGLTDVASLGCDFLACSSYKFFGPHLGLVWAREELLRELYAYKVRPSSDEPPARFELGTPQIEQQAALSATVAYFEWLGRAAAGSRRDAIAHAFARVSPWESALASRLVDGLLAIPGVTIHGITDPARFSSRVPTVSFTHATKSPDSIARALAADGIFVWSGHNYALELVRALGINEETGVVRIGLAHYNTPAEVDRAVEAVERSVFSLAGG